MRISLSNLPAEVEQAIRETSQREGISLNQAAFRLLQAAVAKPDTSGDFEEFFRTWSAEDADAFDATLARMRQVDPADWECIE